MLRIALLAALVCCPLAAAATSHERDVYLHAVDAGIPRTKAIWWNPAVNWFSQRPPNAIDGRHDVATLWDVFPLFEAADLVAATRPSPARRATVELIGRGAERYWNPAFKGYWFLPEQRPHAEAYFDDNGWWALAFFDAYTATRDHRFLRDTVRAFHFIATAGWAKHGGGIWWDTRHRRKTIEPLAAEVLAGAELYGATHNRSYLRESLRLLAWANRHSWNRGRGLYQRNETDPTVMNYAQGIMIAADVRLCRELKRPAFCRRASRLAAASLRAFPPTYHWSNETDAIYYRFLLELYRVDHERRWYRAANRWARKALVDARGSNGVFSRLWDGEPAVKHRLLTPGGTLMLFAALAAAR